MDYGGFKTGAKSLTNIPYNELESHIKAERLEDYVEPVWQNRLILKDELVVGVLVGYYPAKKFFLMRDMSTIHLRTTMALDIRRENGANTSSVFRFPILCGSNRSRIDISDRKETITGDNEVCERAKALRMSQFRVSSTNTHPNLQTHIYESTFIEIFLRSL